MFLLFSIIGVNYLKGLNWGCQGDVFEEFTDEQMELLLYPRLYDNLTAIEKGWAEGSYSGATSKAVCLWLGGTWKNRYHCPQHFDNVFQGLSSFFQASTTEGWQAISYIGIDGRGINMQPIPESNKYWWIFFMLFIFIGAFFILQLFVGVVIDNFNQMKHRLGKDHVFLTDEQREWVELQETLLAMKVKKPLKRPKRIFYFK